MSLIIKNLHLSVEDQEIVKGLNLKVKPGQLHVLMGPNGSGKSSTASALAGHPDYLTSSVELSLDGQSLLDLSADERAKLGLFLAFQYPVEVPGVRVESFLREALRAIRPHDPQMTSALKFRKYLEKLADNLGLDKKFIKRGLNENFSGGEKKRLEILQLLALQPKYAVLDETDSGLDIDAIKVVASGINKAIREFNTGVLLITHYQRILKFLKPDGVSIMVAGKIIKTGGPELAEQLEKDGYQQFERRT